MTATSYLDRYARAYPSVYAATSTTDPFVQAEPLNVPPPQTAQWVADVGSLGTLHNVFVQDLMLLVDPKQILKALPVASEVELKAAWKNKIHVAVHYAAAGLGYSTLKDFAPSMNEEIEAVETALAHTQYAGQVRQRLETLLESYREDNDGRDFSIESLKGFRTFLSAHSQLAIAKPSLTVTDSGLIYARWRRTAHEIFSIYFESLGSCEFVKILPDTAPICERADTRTVGATAGIQQLDWVIAT